jgi:hypothetical protein
MFILINILITEKLTTYAAKRATFDRINRLN